MLKFILIILALIFIGSVTHNIFLFILNIAGIPGAFIANKQNSKMEVYLGLIVSVILQSYIYLSYELFIIMNVKNQIVAGQFVNIIIWFVAAYACMFPIRRNIMNAKLESKINNETMNINLLALEATSGIAFIAFFIFLFTSITLKQFWFWL